MGLTRDKWKADFRLGEPLRWPCPSCHESPLRVVPENLKDGETAASKAMHDHAAFEPDVHVDGRFAGVMDCAHCGNAVGVAGTYRLKDERYEDAEHGEAGDFVKYYRPSYFTESPHLVQMPEKTPEAVAGELLASFQLFWSDPLACTNRIRSSVEKLLTAERVPQTTRNDKGKRVFLTLHNRIERYQKDQKNIAEKLMAMKWIGNAGSHSQGATQDDALDGLELMDWVLDTLYARRHRRASALTRVINRRRAPRSPRRGTKGQ
jgi:uncharacterized protein DUF4145